MGSGAEASEGVLPLLLLVSMGSPPGTSMGCSTERGQAGSVGPRGQQSPPTNFTGLEKKTGPVTSWAEGQRSKASPTHTV